MDVHVCMSSIPRLLVQVKLDTLLITQSSSGKRETSIQVGLASLCRGHQFIPSQARALQMVACESTVATQSPGILGSQQGELTTN
jgi:hypothetical protein